MGWGAVAEGKSRPFRDRPEEEHNPSGLGSEGGAFLFLAPFLSEP